jgi:hypothetical protein
MVNSPLTYENGWGKIFAAIFDWRGDGYVWDVVQRYSTGICTLNVVLHDAGGKPADGMAVTLKSDALWGGQYYCTWGVTNSQGMAQFILGDNRNFYVRVDGPMGYYPSIGQVTPIIANSQAGAAYTWEHTMQLATPALAITQAPPYSQPLNDYRMEIAYQTEYETVYGTYFSNNQFALKTPAGSSDFFIADSVNYSAYMASQPAQGFSILDHTSTDTVAYTLPANERWYGVFSRREYSINRPMVKAVVKIYRNVTPLDVTLTPVNPPIVIPANGGRFEFNASVVNNGPAQQPFWAWGRIYPPVGYPVIVLGPVQINPSIGLTISRLRTQYIDASWVAGVYTYKGFVNWNVTLPAVDSSLFTFTKSTVADGGPWITETANYGEPFPGEEFPPLSRGDRGDLFAASPSPFNAETAISYKLQATSHVSLKVYDVSGRLVANLVDGWQQEGSHQVTFNGSKLSSGLYFVKMQAGGGSSAVRKMMLVK